MQVELTVTLWESNAGDLILTLDADAGGKGQWTMLHVEMPPEKIEHDPDSFARDAADLSCGDTGPWTLPIQMGAPFTAWGAEWRAVAEYDAEGDQVTMLANRVGGGEPGRAAARYLGSAVPA